MSKKIAKNCLNGDYLAFISGIVPYIKKRPDLTRLSRVEINPSYAISDSCEPSNAVFYGPGAMQSSSI